MINTRRIRLIIGVLGMMLPWIVVLLLLRFPQSISATYYTWEAGAVFMIILGSASLLLMSYRGYDKKDDILNTVSGLFGLCICLFPCKIVGLEAVGTFQIPTAVSSVIHNISAGGFFGILAYNSLFQFTKTSGEMTAQKKKRNIIYRVCGGGMIGAFALFLLPDFYIKVWLIETIALQFFGVSWLTKANALPWLFADKSLVK